MVKEPRKRWSWLALVLEGPEHGRTIPLPVIGGLVTPDRSNLIKALNVPSYAHCERGLGDAA
jgi:hypothetical protein